MSPTLRRSRAGGSPSLPSSISHPSTRITVQTHGLTTSTSRGRKSATFRVATAKALALAIPAISSVAHIDGVSSAPGGRPQLGGPLRPRPVQRQYAVAIRGEDTCLHLRQSAAPVPMREQPHTVLDLMYQDRRHPHVVPPSQEVQHPRVGNVPRQLRDYVRVQQVAGHSPSSSAKGMGRLELRSGTSRFVPRGTFSMSHWPRGFRSGLAPATSSPARHKGLPRADALRPLRLRKTQHFRQPRLRLGNRPHTARP